MQRRTVMEMSNLEDLFIEQLKDVYNAEGQLVKALPKMAKAASYPQLKEAFQIHLAETKGHVEQLQRVFEMFGQPVKGKKCAAMEGLLEEGKELMSEDAAADVMDAGLIGAAQKVEHYEIATYGTLRTYAQVLGNDQAARILQRILDEEGQTDKKLT